MADSNMNVVSSSESDYEMEISLDRLRSQMNRQQRSRERESEEERSVRHSLQRSRQRLRRSRESQEERQERIESNRSRTSARRTSLDVQHRYNLRQRNTAQHALARDNETEISRRQRLDREIQRRHQPTIGLAGSEVTPDEHYIGRMNLPCQDCNALHFPGEPHKDHSYNMCCSFGSVLIEKFQNYPEILKELLTQQTTEGRQFRRLIRNYNSALAMASMGAQLDVPRGRGPYCFRLHDQVYHFVGPLHPDFGRQPKFGQIYILDTEKASEERMANPANVDCDPELMRQLGNFMMENNRYAQSFRMMQDVLNMEKEMAERQGRPTEPVRMVFDINEHLDKRRFNVPVANEVAVVFVGVDEDVPPNKNYAVHEIGGGLRNIRDIDPEVDPLIYPLLFPDGEPGWHTELRKPNGKRITQLQYYRGMIQERSAFNPLFRSGKLFQQFAVDSFVKIEQNRLNFERTHQKDLRADTYLAVRDYVAGDGAAGPPGKRIILPSSFKSGPRGMRQSYQDAMSIVAKYGKPDYFLTFTSNPNWKEIKEQLKEV